MRRWPACVLLLLLAAPGWAAVTPGAPKAARNAYEQAVKHFAKQSYEQARFELEAALAAWPEYGAAHFLLAKTHYVSKRYGEALAAVANAERHWQGGAAGGGADAAGDRLERVNRQRRAIQDRIDESYAALDRVLTDEQRRPIETHISELQRTLAELERQASQPVAVAAAGGAPAEYHFVHGNILLRMNRLPEAEAEYKLALAAQPRYPEAANNLASLYYQAGRMQDALDVLAAAESKGLTINLELKRAVESALR